MSALGSKKNNVEILEWSAHYRQDSSIGSLVSVVEMRGTNHERSLNRHGSQTYTRFLNVPLLGRRPPLNNSTLCSTIASNGEHVGAYVLEGIFDIAKFVNISLPQISGNKN